MTRIWLVAALLAATADGTAAERVDAEAMLAAHNAVRAEVGVAPLGWSAELAADAAAWADHLAAENACRMQHADTRQQGENLYWASPKRWSDGRTEVQAITPQQVVDSWAAEKAHYDYATNTCHGEACGHYTQLVWAETKRVGCARRVCADKAQLWVCRYTPPGNWVGQKPY